MCVCMRISTDCVWVYTAFDWGCQTSRSLFAVKNKEIVNRVDHNLYCLKLVACTESNVLFSCLFSAGDVLPHLTMNRTHSMESTDLSEVNNRTGLILFLLNLPTSLPPKNPTSLLSAHSFTVVLHRDKGAKLCTKSWTTRWLLEIPLPFATFFCPELGSAFLDSRLFQIS